MSDSKEMGRQTGLAVKGGVVEGWNCTYIRYDWGRSTARTTEDSDIDMHTLKTNLSSLSLERDARVPAVYSIASTLWHLGASGQHYCFLPRPSSHREAERPPPTLGTCLTEAYINYSVSRTIVMHVALIFSSCLSVCSILNVIGHTFSLNPT